MEPMRLRPSFALLFLLVPGLVWGQTVVADDGTRAVQRTYVSSPVDTAAFFPQVMPSLGQKAITVPNVFAQPDAPFAQNRLPLGRQMGEQRGSAGGHFPGIGPSGLTPPDSDIAVGPGHVVQVINSQIAFFTKAGSNVFQQSSLNFFAGLGATSFQFDPKAFYDRANGRFVLVFVERSNATLESKVLVAVSDDNDPNGTWFRYRIEAKVVVGTSQYWLDYPGFGYGGGAYVVTGNMFALPGSSGFAGVQFIVMPAAPMLVGNPVTVTSLRDSTGASAQVGETLTGASTSAYAVARRSDGVSLRVYAVTNPTTAPALVFTSVTVPSNTGPSADAQSTNGRTLDTIDARVYNAAIRDGRLVTAHSARFSSSITGSRWYEVDLGSWPSAGGVTLVQAGTIESATTNRFMPAINKNKTGRISTLFTSSSTSLTADVSLAARLPGDPDGAIGAPVALETSAGTTYSGTRWGDYFGVDVDPVDDVTFWGTGMVVAAGNNWQTHIRNWTVPGPEAAVPDAFQLFRGFLNSGNVASLANDDNNFLSVSAGITANPGESPLQLIVETNAPSSVVFGIDFSLRAKVSTVGLAQRIELWNFATGQWDVLGQAASTMTESVLNVSASGNVLNYLQPGTNRLRAKVVWTATGPTSHFPWTADVDQARWTIVSA
ncbi:MAG: hypothetical protein WD716_06100 [Fimbriimonadaceae bacterium]